MERRGTEDISARSGPSTRALNERPARFAQWRRVFRHLALSRKRVWGLPSTVCDETVGSLDLPSIARGGSALDRLVRGGGVFGNASPGRLPSSGWWGKGEPWPFRRGDGGVCLSRRAARGPRLGMGLDVESSSGPGLGFPPGFWFLLWG